MLKKSLLAVLLTAFVPVAAFGAPDFVRGNLGNIGDVSQIDANLHAKAARGMRAIVARELGVPAAALAVRAISRDELGAVHVRFQQTLNGLAVHGGGSVLHAHADGTVYAVNGELMAGDLPRRPQIPAATAMVFALGEAGIRGEVGPAELAYVLDAAGNGHLAWKADVTYVNENGPQRDTIFADAIDGGLAARHPQIHYALSLQTYDCGGKTKNCTLAAQTPPDSIPVSTGDTVVDNAHNFAAGTYNYYWNVHGRDSIDDNGMTIVSYVHWDTNSNQAWWDGAGIRYGDGDGVNTGPLCNDADVVGHELTHGVTEVTSALIYSNESGALSESISDIFGSEVDRQEGATGADIWYVGEDVMLTAAGIRNMADPAEFGDFDYYPDRYTGTSDNGGVHWNSGISNLAYVLLSDGGTHPRGKTTIVVPAITNVKARQIFYWANVNCMTASSNFAAARFCTETAASSLYGQTEVDAVRAAWDAVGVTDSPPPPSSPIALQDGVPLGGQSGTSPAVQQYTLAVAANDTVTCTTSCNNGDADLYLRFGAEAEANPSSSVNECGSYATGSNESCTTGAASSATTLYAAVHAYNSYTDLTITCSIGGSCSLSGASCTADSECCSGSCKGKPGSKTCS